jgi:hypothetical protein
LNPLNYLGIINRIVDKRSIVYIIGSSEKSSLRVIVLISFDLVIKLLGLKE